MLNRHHSALAFASTFARVCVPLSVGLLATLPASAAGVAAGPELVAGTLNMFRDFRGANSVGVSSGDRVQYGADIVGGSADVLVSAVASTGFVSAAAPCSPLTVNANFCANGTSYNANRLAPWQVSFARGGAVTTVTGPSLVGVDKVPFPTSVTMSGTGLTPTISWVLPAGVRPDGFRINVDDKSSLRANGTADIIFSQTIAPNATSFTLPGNLGLSSSGSYAINFQLIETRGHAAFTGNNAQIFSRSNSWFDFTPLTGNVPLDIALPTIDARGVYNFSVGNVGADHITFIDPDVAVGYRYAVGATGPNFQSLLLPNVGDGVYTLAYTDGTGSHSTTLAHDSQLFFASGGVSAFTVTGIETSAGLDPTSGSAFITGLTFSAPGAFTGTMTPITEFVAGVPEPGTWLMMAMGLGGLGGLGGLAGLARRRAAGTAR